MKSKELKSLGLDELQEKLDDTLKSLYQLRIRSVSKELEQTSQIRSTRRDIARIKQAIGEKQRESATAGAAK